VSTACSLCDFSVVVVEAIIVVNMVGLDVVVLVQLLPIVPKNKNDGTFK
jgi:hypothetical protein